jgi:hypothetical protein
MAEEPRKRPLIVAVLRRGIDAVAKSTAKIVMPELRGQTRKPPRRADGTPVEALRHRPETTSARR